MLERARSVGVVPRIDEHQTILAALRERNPKAAREAMRDHLARVIDGLLTATESDAFERARAEVEARRTDLARRVAI
jgi:GntR family transcriptional repressor for pyruvate dehydrogenase complex